MAADGVILLTGAASGIGRASAEALALKSRALALVDVNGAALQRVANVCRKTAPQTAYFPCDIADADAVKSACQQIHEQFGRVSVLVNCAGIGHFAPFLEITPEDWVRFYRVNVMGAVHVTRAVLPGMIAAREGTIINVGSRMAVDGFPATSAYAATKAALLAFSKALAAEVSDSGVKVCFLGPGGTKTNIATPKHEGYLEPSAVAEAIVYITENSGNTWVRDLFVLPLGF